MTFFEYFLCYVIALCSSCLLLMLANTAHQIYFPDQSKVLFFSCLALVITAPPISIFSIMYWADKSRDKILTSHGWKVIEENIATKCLKALIQEEKLQFNKKLTAWWDPRRELLSIEQRRPEFTIIDPVAINEVTITLAQEEIQKILASGLGPLERAAVKLAKPPLVLNLGEIKSTHQAMEILAKP